MYINFLIDVAKFLIRHHLREEGLILACSLKGPSSLWSRRHGGWNVTWLLSLIQQSGNRKWTPVIRFLPQTSTT